MIIEYVGIFYISEQRPLSAGHKPQGDPRNQMNRGHNKKPEVCRSKSFHICWRYFHRGQIVETVKEKCVPMLYFCHMYAFIPI